ncbi:phage shock protein A (PspA) family protein [Granulicella rosea]|uniref:Phage shock protein A (PspA) family protein n=1 Tax=Granulicella rosea TaxID=474952 RepID=A0A239DVB3_9BACT|nr:PspA/IM30 family protein [Granulicella rosea]SNS35544.1 phage shock protein A (PspA) family protein [Granulicella rosea]
MALLERVGTLLRANINDLLAKAEDPEKLARQLVLDMENQLLQVKTQVAIAIADQHLLLKKKKEHEDAQAEWRRKAELAVAKQQDDLARAALERSLASQRLAQGYVQQLEDQTAEAETLRGAYTRLQQKLTETKARVELLIAQHRRARTAAKAATAQALLGTHEKQATLNRLSSSVKDAEQGNTLSRTLTAINTSDTLEERFAVLEQEDQIEALLLELKGQQRLT